ncbi:MAG: PP2C family protein-serine/threonine phosphatase [Acidimicrobiales bacterium]
MAAVRRYGVLDTPPDGNFDRITALAARLFGVPIAIVSIVDEDRIWFKSRYGLDATEVPRTPGLCASAILQDAPLVIGDARLDPVALTNPLVAGEFGLRFYAAAPLVTADNHKLGTLCIIDREPRALGDTEVATLSDLAALVIRELELRLQARSSVAEATELRREAEVLAGTLQATMLPPSLPEIAGMEVASRYRPAQNAVVGGDFYDLFPLPKNAWGVVIGDVRGKGSEAASFAVNARHVVRAAVVDHDAPSDVLRFLNSAIRPDLDEEAPFCTIVYARLEPDSDSCRVTLSSGGHPLPFVLRRDGAVERVGRHGTLIGVLDNVTVSDSSIVLRRGDALVTFTDGLTEARTDGYELGSAGVSEILAACAGQSADQIAETLEQAATGPSHPQRDDLAVVVLRVDDRPRGEAR